MYGSWISAISAAEPQYQNFLRIIARQLYLYACTVEFMQQMFVPALPLSERESPMHNISGAKGPFGTVAWE
jgi:hypothetical protein